MRYRKRLAQKEVRKKNRRKIVRTVFEILFCLSVIMVFVAIVFYPKQYKEPDKSQWGQGQGFIALSYAGVSYNDNENLISKGELDSHLRALHDAGYITIGIQDVINYYNNGGLLPEKALLLIFEDGRKDSFIFAQPVLEKYNFKAIMFTYASNIEDKNRLFLKERDLKYLDKSSYWEVGSNGYRFSYINVYENKTVGADNTKSEEKKFTHYLMDYLRDEDGIPTESKKQMQQRITKDYEEMSRVYTGVLGYEPQVYMIMHANSLFNNMNAAVENVNLDNIYKHFKLMFNREGSCYNTKDDSIYDLTRMQVNPDWTADKLSQEIENYAERR